MKRISIPLVGAVLFARLAFAHGDEQHYMGTVTKMTDTTITVKVPAKRGATQGINVTVTVVASTKFEKMGAAATIKDVKVGDHIVVHAAKKGGKLEAHVVKIGMTMDDMQHECEVFRSIDLIHFYQGESAGVETVDLRWRPIIRGESFTGD